jgi:hypothetical protein
MAIYEFARQSQRVAADLPKCQACGKHFEVRMPMSTPRQAVSGYRPRSCREAG